MSGVDGVGGVSVGGVGSLEGQRGTHNDSADGDKNITKIFNVKR